MGLGFLANATIHLTSHQLHGQIIYRVLNGLDGIVRFGFSLIQGFNAGARFFQCGQALVLLITEGLKVFL